MKKDIDTLIAEEHAEIISKYDKVGLCTGIPFPTSEGKRFTIDLFSHIQDMYDEHKK